MGFQVLEKPIELRNITFNSLYGILSFGIYVICMVNAFNSLYGIQQAKKQGSFDISVFQFPLWDSLYATKMVI